MKKLTQHIFLIGFMGVGKTSTSHALGKKLGVGEIDTDAVIVEREGREIAAIFQQEGEEYFRRKETALLDEIGKRSPCVVSCGGGMAMRPENVEKMKSQGRIVFLTAEPETIYEHVKDSSSRPLLNGNMNVEYIRELMASRTPAYQAAADVTVKTDQMIPWQVAEKILQLL